MDTSKLTLSDVIAEYVSSDYCDPKSYVFVLFMKECYTQVQRDEVMEGLMACKCCTRHQEHKTLCHKPSGAVSEEKTCSCNCRHYARLFKRNELA